MEHTIELIIECQECGHPNDYTLSIKYLVCPIHIEPPKWVCVECGLEQAFNSNNVVYTPRESDTRLYTSDEIDILPCANKYSCMQCADRDRCRHRVE